MNHPSIWGYHYFWKHLFVLALYCNQVRTHLSSFFLSAHFVWAYWCDVLQLQHDYQRMDLHQQTSVFPPCPWITPKEGLKFRHVGCILVPCSPSIFIFTFQCWWDWDTPKRYKHLHRLTASTRRLGGGKLKERHDVKLGKLPKPTPCKCFSVANGIVVVTGIMVVGGGSCQVISYIYILYIHTYIYMYIHIYVIYTQTCTHTNVRSMNILTWFIFFSIFACFFREQLTGSNRAWSHVLEESLESQEWRNGGRRPLWLEGLV